MSNHIVVRDLRGFMLLEALIGMLIFSIGVLGLVSLQSNAIKTATDARGRSEAAFLANQVVARMWTDRTNLAAYSLNPFDAACAVGSNSSLHPPLANWLGYVQGAGGDPGLLPGADGLIQQIALGANNEVTVTLCWVVPGGEVHRHVARSQIRFN